MLPALLLPHPLVWRRTVSDTLPWVGALCATMAGESTLAKVPRESDASLNSKASTLPGFSSAVAQYGQDLAWTTPPKTSGRTGHLGQRELNTTFPD
ncbi:hypothetical protein M3J09_011268 [Ascochyta lentis]